jgi:hypothetical protein
MPHRAPRAVRKKSKRRPAGKTGRRKTFERRRPDKNIGFLAFFGRIRYTFFCRSTYRIFEKVNQMNIHENDAQVQFRQAVLRAAQRLMEKGYHVIPLRGKDCYEQGWQTTRHPIAELKPRILAGENIGIVFGQDAGDGTSLIGLDVDLDQPHLANAVRSRLPDASARIGRWPKFLMPLRVRDEEAASRDYTFWDGPNLGASHMAIQVLGRGQRAPAGPKQAAAYGIHPETRQPYVWKKDSEGLTIFDKEPKDWPLIDDLAGLMASIATDMEKHGWRTRTPRAPSEPGATFDGEMSERMVERDRQLIEQELEVISKMTSGMGRGNRAYRLGLRVGATIKAGHIDLDDVLARLEAAMPDNAGDLRSFERGVEQSEGLRQAKMAESEHVDWEAEAEAQGVKFEEPVKDAPDAEEQASGGGSGASGAGAGPPPPGFDKTVHPLARKFSGGVVDLKLIW